MKQIVTLPVEEEEHVTTTVVPVATAVGKDSMIVLLQHNKLLYRVITYV